MPFSPAESGLDRTVREDGLALFLKGRTVSFLGHLLGAVVLAVPAWALIGPEIVPPLLAVLCLLNLGVLLVKRYLAGLPPDANSFDRRSRLAALNTGLQGAGLALATVWLHRLAGEEMLLYAVAVQAGLAAASLGIAPYHPPAMRSFLLCGLGLYLASLLFVPPSLEVQVIGAGTSFALVFLLFTGHQQAGVLRSAIRLRHENDALLKQLAAENRAAEAARQEAEQANREKSRFFASASHDLRQPVHALNLYTSLLRSPASEAEREEVLDRISACVETLDDLFESLLTVTRAEGSEISALAPLPLDAVIGSVVAKFAPVAEARGLRLGHVASSIWVRSEKLTLDRILSNLVANAIAFTPHGRVLIGARRRGSEVELQVLDTGIGIQPEEQDRIFGEFYQVHNPGRRSGTGFGLGLVIVQRLCRALDYRVKLTSTPGLGSCFAVRLPRCAPAPGVADTQPLQASVGLKRGVHVLLVDDDERVRDAMGRMLADWQVGATICASSNEALAYARSHRDEPACLLLDERLGGEVDGLELAGQLLAVLSRSVPVAIVTGETAGDWFDEAHALGYTVLFKPVKPIRLRAFLVAASRTASA